MEIQHGWFVFVEQCLTNDGNPLGSDSNFKQTEIKNTLLIFARIEFYKHSFIT